MLLPRGPAFGLMATLLLSACVSNGLDWDLRRGGGFDTSAAAQRATDNRPQADANGVISYSGYQVVVARRGDTVASIAQRLGIDAGALASYNALRPSDNLREGETIALPNRVASTAVAVAPGAPVTGGIIGATPPANSGGRIDVTTIAGSAIDRAAPPPAVGTKPAAPTGGDPVRHKVQRGETAYTIARAYNVSAKSIADWNGLGADLAVREGQILTIPTSSGAAPAAAAAPVVVETPPGQGSPTPTPPSAKKPLPKDEAPAAQQAKETPKSPELGEQRTGATATKLVMPVSGKIIRSYQKKKNEGIDISAAAGTAVKAADAGTVAAVTKDTNGTPIVVIRHANNLLTVYAGVDSLKVQKGATVARGQAIAVVRGGSPAFLHFEVRKGVESVDPIPYLQ